MIDDDDCSLPFLLKTDGSKIVLNLGDSQCIISDDKDDNRQFLYFLPGKYDGEILCTFSALFDGSVMLSKESNSAPEVYVNGNRIATGINIDIQTGDSVVLGSSRYSYFVDLNDADAEEAKSNTLKSTDDVFIDIFVSGDMKINFVDFDTGKEISLDQQLLNTAKGIALSSFQQLEITEWMRWLGLPTNGTVLLNRKHRMLEWKVEISAGIIDDLAVADSQGDYSYMRNLTFQYSLNQHFDNKIRRPGFSALLTRFEDYCASFSKVLVALRTTEIGKNEDMSASTFMSENSLPKELLAPMLNLFTWGDHAEEAKQTGPIPSPAGLIESTLDCIGNIEVETYTEMSLVGTVCHEIRRQYMRSKNAGEGGEKEGEKLGQGSEKWTIAWIKKCCCILSALCYCGDSLPPMQGYALSEVLMPHWAAAAGKNKNKNKENLLFRTVMITMRVIILLSVKNMLNTDPAHANGKTDGKEKETGSSPLDSTTGSSLDSFLRPFSLAAEALNEFGSQRIAPEQYIFLDDLKCMLRWSLPAH